MAHVPVQCGERFGCELFHEVCDSARGDEGWEEREADESNRQQHSLVVDGIHLEKEREREA